MRDSIPDTKWLIIPDNIKKIIDIIVEFEGGYQSTSDHDDDKGGWTRAGITRTLFNKIWATNYSNDSIKYMPNSIIRLTYYNAFWHNKNWNKLFNLKKTDLVFMDALIQHGEGTASEIMQKTLNKYVTVMNAFITGVSDSYNIIKENKYLKEDGIFGSKTTRRFKLLRMIDPIMFEMIIVSYLVHFRRDYYIKLCVDDNTQIVFLQGWINRLDKLKET